MSEICATSVGAREMKLPEKCPYRMANARRAASLFWLGIQRARVHRAVRNVTAIVML
jgi:hypothetical protein